MLSRCSKLNLWQRRINDSTFRGFGALRLTIIMAFDIDILHAIDGERALSVLRILDRQWSTPLGASLRPPLVPSRSILWVSSSAFLPASLSFWIARLLPPFPPISMVYSTRFSTIVLRSGLAVVR